MSEHNERRTSSGQGSGRRKNATSSGVPSHIDRRVADGRTGRRSSDPHVDQPRGGGGGGDRRMVRDSRNEARR